MHHQPSQVLPLLTVPCHWWLAFVTTPFFPLTLAVISWSKNSVFPRCKFSEENWKPAPLGCTFQLFIVRPRISNQRHKKHNLTHRHMSVRVLVAGPFLSSVQSLSRVRLFATPWIAARQASLSITFSRSSLRLMSIESVMPSSHLILCRPLLLLPPIPASDSASESFPMSQLFAWGGQSTRVSALASFLSKKSQGWSPSEWTGWISLQTVPI